MTTLLGVTIGLFSLAMSVYVGRISIKQYRQRKSTTTYLQTRRVLRESRIELQRTATRIQKDLIHSATAPVISHHDWIPPIPVDLADVRLILKLDHPAPVNNARNQKLLRRYWPFDSAGNRMDCYHEAVNTLDPPKNWFDADCYRMLAIHPRAGTGPELTFGTTRYWDGFDNSEALAHESAHMFLKTGKRTVVGPFRRALRDPFDFEGRICNSSFATLTIRRDSSHATFFLHRRDERVAVGANETSVVPAGEFQPSDDSRFSLERDLDLWSSIVREYAEEFLGVEEARVRRGAPIDYDKERPFCAFQAARRRGEILAYFLGVGIDPLSWKAQMYTVCIFKAAAFDRLFSRMQPENLEGVLEIPTRHRRKQAPFQGWDFSEENVRRYLENSRLSPSAKATLGLTWANRSVLGLTFPKDDAT